MSFWEFFFLLLIFLPMMMLWLFTLTDLSRRTDLSGPAKGLWAIAVVLLPIIGMLIYFITRTDGFVGLRPTELGVEPIEDDKDFDAMVARLEQLAELHSSNILSDEEFASAKARMLNS